MSEPDETRTFPKGAIEVAKFDDHTVGRFRLEPGWKWSESVKPKVGTDNCENLHVGYCTAGSITIRLVDGTETEINAGDAYTIPPGHDAWVTGDATYEGLEFASAADYGVKK
jgi:quercetin dioxygenase-like cupin family protein